METIQLPPRIISYLKNNDEIEDDNYIIGGILNDSRHGWLSNGSKLIVINLSTAVKIAAWTFGAILRDYKARVTCVYELTTPLIEQTMQLLIGLECELIGGMVCLFHCNGSRVLRAIQVDCQIVCLQYIEKINGSPFGCFDGTVIIGTHGGGVFLFDLNKKDCIEAMSNLNNDIMDELNNANLVVLSIDNINIISQQRTIACEKGHHIAVQINEGCSHNLQFILRDPDNEVKLETDRDQVFVTNVLYIPQIESLVIGLSIGAFQIWNLQTLELQFTSPLNVGGIPIAHIGFMEPCDDPRAFCYLWIVHSTLNRHDEGFPIAIMYSLTYGGKKTNKDYKTIYQNFLSCNLRFNLDLTNIDGVNNIGKFIGGRSLGCHTLTKTANKEDADEYVLNICQMVWECWTVSAIAPVQSLMIFFDIDQWYKEQMPEICELKTNNYVSLVNLGDIFSHTGSSYLCDVKINSDTLTSYVSVQRLEEHFFPNAIGYECHCLTNTNITKFVTMGVQRQLLASINKVGPSILLHPTKLFHQCISTGLIPLYVDPQPSINTPEPIQREILLSVALEARLIQFLGKCACDWATGSHSSVGCTLQLLLDWSWKRTLILKQNGDQLATSFFDHSTEMPDRFTIQCLDSCVRQLGHIAMLYNIIIEKCSNYILPDKIFEIKHCQKIVKMVAQYFQVIQWFLNVGLLPEFSDDHPENGDYRLPYPIQSLVKFYQNRRFKLHCLNGDNPAHEDLKNKHCHFLFIDQFIDTECSGSKLQLLWMQDESTIKGLYPPPSLHSLLKIYLIPDMKEEYKHSLVLYALVDYAMIYDSERYEGVIHRLMQFPTMFGLSNTAIKITQAFWHLDHRDFQLALNQLQCVLAGGCLTQWQHNVVLSALLVQKKTQSALQYLHVRKPCISSSGNEGFINIYDDWDACSNLYLSRGLMYEAFQLNKESIKSLPASIHEQRLRVFFDGCRKVGLLNKVVLLPLSQNEESIFINYLKAIDDPQSNDIIVLYYLRRSRYIEAKQANESLKRYSNKAQLPYNVTNDFSMRKEHVHKTEARDQLVDLYYKTLPPITRQLAQYTNANQINQKMVIPTPMTVNVQTSTHKSALYKSSFIQETINKANETWLKNPTIIRNLKRTFQIEDTPFLCAPKLTNCDRLDEKMSTTPDGTPIKKIKLNDDAIETPLNTITPKLKKEIDTLLHTPLVERKCRNFSSSTKNNRYSSVKRSSFRSVTPQSILKVKKSHDCFISSPIDERLTMETDDEIDAISQYSHSTVSRSIRFNLPSQNSSPHSFDYASDLQDSYNELCGHNINNQENVSSTSQKNITPRKSIHSNNTTMKTPEISVKCVEETQLEDDDVDYEDNKKQCLSLLDSKENLETSVQHDDNVSQCESVKDDQNSVYSIDDNVSHRSVDSMCDITSIGPSQSIVKFPRARRSIRESKKVEKDEGLSINERYDIMERTSFVSQECSVFNETKMTEIPPERSASEIQIKNATNTSADANLLNDSILPSEDESFLDTSNATFSIKSELKSLFKKSIFETKSYSVTEVQSFISEKSKTVTELHGSIDLESNENELDEGSVIAEADQVIAEDEEFDDNAVEIIESEEIEKNSEDSYADEESDDDAVQIIESEENEKNSEESYADNIDQELFKMHGEEPVLVVENDVVIEETTKIDNAESTHDNVIEDEAPAIAEDDLINEEHSEIYCEPIDVAADDVIIEEPTEIYDEEPSEICNEEPTDVPADDIINEDEAPAVVEDDIIIEDEAPAVAEDDIIIENEAPAVAEDDIIIEEPSEIYEEEPADLAADNSKIQDETPAVYAEDVLIEEPSEYEQGPADVGVDDVIFEDVSEVQDDPNQPSALDVNVTIEEPLEMCDKVTTAVADCDVTFEDVTEIQVEKESVSDKTKNIQEMEVESQTACDVICENKEEQSYVSLEINDDSNANSAFNNNINSSEEIDSDLIVSAEFKTNAVVNNEDLSESKSKLAESEECEELDEEMKLIYNEDDEDLVNKAYIETTPESSSQGCDTEFKQENILSETLDSSIKNDAEEVPVENKDNVVSAECDFDVKEVEIVATDLETTKPTEIVVGLNMPSLEHLSSNGDSNASALQQGTSKLSLPINKRKYQKRASSFSSDNSLHIIEENSDSVIMEDSISLEKSTTSTKDELRNEENVRRGRKRANSISSLDESRMSSSRRSTRNSSKLDMSFVSQSSIDSDQESTTSSLRKMRRSVLTKPNLSVIPEDDRSHLDRTNASRKNSSTLNIIEEYSSTRRLTRHQRSLMEKSIETSSSMQVERSSTIDTQIRDSVDSEGSDRDNENDNMSHCSSFTEKTLDPILLLDKQDFEGQPDLDECVVCDSAINSSRASSIVSDMDIDTGGYSLRKRDLEAYSCGKIPLKDHHKLRMTPVKMMDTSIDNPSSSGSPSGRPRRTSFNKAIEALCTPKRKRRTSIDSRKSDNDSMNISLAEKLPKDDTIKEESPEKASSEQQNIEIAKVMTPKKRIISEFTKKSSVEQSPVVKEMVPETNAPREPITESPKKSASPIAVIEKKTGSPKQSSKIASKQLSNIAEKLLEKAIVTKQETVAQSPDLKEDDKLTDLPVIKEKRTRRTSLMQIIEDKPYEIVKEKRVRKAASVHGGDADTTKVMASPSSHVEGATLKKTRKPKKASSLHEQETASETPVRRTRQSIITTPLSKEERMSIISKELTYKKRTGVNKAVQPLQFVVKK